MDSQELSARIDLLEHRERAAAAERDRRRGSTTAICLSLLAATMVVAALLLAQRQGWIADSDLSTSSWTVTAALAGALLEVTTLVVFAILPRMQRYSERDDSPRALHEGDQGSTASGK